MIKNLAPPSACIIDDEQAEYEAISAALFELGVGFFHVKGDSIAALPQRPVSGLRIVFTDLHLNGSTGRDAASHTANVFTKIVRPDDVPILVVIWSKYAADGHEDELSEAELFKQYLLEANESYKNSLVFMTMEKLKPVDRPATRKWIKELVQQIKIETSKFEALDVLWGWESLVRQAGVDTIGKLLTISSSGHDENSVVNADSINQNTKKLLSTLACAQGGPNCNKDNAVKHLHAILAELVSDHLQKTEPDSNSLKLHGEWLAKSAGDKKYKEKIRPAIHALTILSDYLNRSIPFIPGTVYKISNPEKIKSVCGLDVQELALNITTYNDLISLQKWMKEHKPDLIAIEISPECDVQQSKRQQALLLIGFSLSREAAKKLNNSPTTLKIKEFTLNESGGEKQVSFVFSSLFKMTMNPNKKVRWLKPYCRLRELPTATLRGGHSSNAARVGYFSID